jgi:hypothetical protein
MTLNYTKDDSLGAFLEAESWHGKTALAHFIQALHSVTPPGPCQAG